MAGGGQIEVDDAGATNVDCGVADVNNTDQILVTGAGTIVINLSGGPFAPGEEVEGTGTSEIEFGVAVGIDVTIEGSSAADNIVIGETTTGTLTTNINLNGDNDTDLTADATAVVTVFGMGGDDVVSANGGTGTGDPEQDGVSLFGGDGLFDGGVEADTLTGGDGPDLIEGEEGPDILNGADGDRKSVV